MGHVTQSWVKLEMGEEGREVVEEEEMGTSETVSCLERQCHVWNPHS